MRSDHHFSSHFQQQSVGKDHRFPHTLPTTVNRVFYSTFALRKQVFCNISNVGNEHTLIACVSTFCQNWDTSGLGVLSQFVLMNFASSVNWKLMCCESWKKIIKKMSKGKKNALLPFSFIVVQLCLFQNPIFWKWFLFQSTENIQTYHYFPVAHFKALDINHVIISSLV